MSEFASLAPDRDRRVGDPRHRLSRHGSDRRTVIFADALTDAADWASLARGPQRAAAAEA